jgi:hypothetical protein
MDLNYNYRYILILQEQLDKYVTIIFNRIQVHLIVQ